MLTPKIMKFHLVSFALLLVVGNVLINGASIDLTYDDLLQTKVACVASESCKEKFADQSQDRTCGCDSDCSDCGNCCIDSKHRDNPARTKECRNVASSFSKMGYFLVSKCPPHVSSSKSPWKYLCEKDWTEKEDYMMKHAPVTSLVSSVSYKNYYCFRCHENGDAVKFLNWDIHVMTNDYSIDKSKATDGFSVTYDKEGHGWNAKTKDGYILKNMQWDFVPPEKLKVPPKACHFVLVSDCAPSWKDEDARKKCGAYTAVVYSKHNDSVSYKNPHCALCNSQPAKSIDCGYQAFQNRPPFSMADLLRTRQNNQQSTGRSCGQNQIWDSFANICRQQTCIVPGYVLRNGQCGPS